jgi:hypothetical protein
VRTGTSAGWRVCPADPARAIILLLALPVMIFVCAGGMSAQDLAPIGGATRAPDNVRTPTLEETVQWLDGLHFRILDDRYRIEATGECSIVIHRRLALPGTSATSYRTQVRI